VDQSTNCNEFPYELGFCGFEYLGSLGVQKKKEPSLVPHRLHLLLEGHAVVNLSVPVGSIVPLLNLALSINEREHSCIRLDARWLEGEVV
jgi:hypothetical protein